MNQIELAYSYTHSDSSIDPSLIIADGRLNLNQGTITYTRYFSFAHRMAWIAPSIPIAGLDGSVDATRIHGSITGAGDSTYEMALLLKGGPALSVAEFEKYRPTTTIGLSLVVTAPTGHYDPNRVLNLGSNRWSFNPELAVSWPFGPEQKWALDAYANAGFYTNNTSYEGRQILGQEPLPGFEEHVSYSFRDSLVASLDARYSFRGETTVNHVSQNDAQKNFILGGEVIVSLNERNSLGFIFAKALVHENGPTSTGFSVKYDYVWGKGYR